MLRRLIVIGLVFVTCLLLLFLQNKVLVGTQELSAELKSTGENTWQVVLKDVAGNIVPATEADTEVVKKRLGGNETLGLPAVPVLGVSFEDSDRRILIKTQPAAEGKPGTDETELRTRVVTKSYKRDNAPRSLFHITKGIDLLGGVEFTCRLKNEEGRVVPADDEVLTILRTRLDERGLTEPTVTRLSNGDAQVVIPGGTKADAARTRRVLESSGRLEFREVLQPFRTARPDGRENGREAHSIETSLGKPDSLVIAKGNGMYVPAPNSDIYLGRGELLLAEEPRRGDQPTTFYRLAKPSLVGKDVKDAHREVHEGKDAVGIQFTSSGGAKNEEFTRSVKARGDARQGTGFMAIVFDNVVKSAPIIQSASGSSCVITGQFTPDQIEDLRSTLRGGSLSVTPEVLSERVVGATLGEETIRKGLLAMAVSFFAIVIFMQFYYGRRLGTVANLCLVATTFVIWAILSVFGATVTLPGLAGLVLTIGMAVDTNILIFERIREELREQKGMKAAIEAGYDRAFLTIVDAHLTTLITAFILYWIGSGPVKGFGLTLIIGILVNLFSGVFIGRMLTDWFCGKVESVKMASWVPELNLPYVEWRRVGYAFSIITGLLGILWFSFGHVITKRSFESNFDIDFTGGNMVQVIFQEEMAPERIDQAVNAAHAADPTNLALIDPAELRKQPYFAEFGAASSSSRQWVFRSRDEGGSVLEKQSNKLNNDRAAIQRKIDDLRGEKPDEAAARKLESTELEPLKVEIDKLRIQIANRTEAFKSQLSKAFAGSISADGADVLQATWNDRTLSLRLATLGPASATAADEIAQRLKKRNSLEDVRVTPVAGISAFDTVITWKSLLAAKDSFEAVDGASARLYDLFKAEGVSEGDRNARATMAAELYNDLVNVAASQKVTVARPFPSSEHFSGQVADQMKWQALAAILLSLLAIMAYVASRFEFRFGIGAVLSLFHDVVLTVGILSVMGVRIDLTVIAALLTIIGFSINDTIVTFDRIRELMRANAGKPVPLDMAHMINLGIAQTMPRTALTTGTVFLTVLVLALFGGEALHAFALTLSIGILSGTYSSIFVAAPLLLSFKGKIDDTPLAEDPNALSTEVASETKPATEPLA